MCKDFKLGLLFTDMEHFMCAIKTQFQFYRCQIFCGEKYTLKISSPEVCEHLFDCSC